MGYADNSSVAFCVCMIVSILIQTSFIKINQSLSNIFYFSSLYINYCTFGLNLLKKMSKGQQVMDSYENAYPEWVQHIEKDF